MAATAAGGELELEDVSEPGGTLEHGDASVPAGTDAFVFAPTTALPVVEEKCPHHHRAVSSDPEQGPRDGDEIREERTRVEARVLNQEAAPGLVIPFEPGEGTRVF